MTKIKDAMKYLAGFGFYFIGVFAITMLLAVIYETTWPVYLAFALIAFEIAGDYLGWHKNRNIMIFRKAVIATGVVYFICLASVSIVLVL